MRYPEEAEAQILVAIRSKAAAPYGYSAAVSRVAPATATPHMVPTTSTMGISLIVAGIITINIPTPLQNITTHIIDTKLIRSLSTHRFSAR